MKVLYGLVILGYLSGAEVKKIIMGLNMKHCETDAIPTDILKVILPLIIHNIIDISNLSLEQGVFVHQWKRATKATSRLVSN